VTAGELELGRAHIDRDERRRASDMSCGQRRQAGAADAPDRDALPGLDARTVGDRAASGLMAQPMIEPRSLGVLLDEDLPGAGSDRTTDSRWSRCSPGGRMATRAVTIMTAPR